MKEQKIGPEPLSLNEKHIKLNVSKKFLKMQTREQVGSEGGGLFFIKVFKRRLWCFVQAWDFPLIFIRG